MEKIATYASYFDYGIFGFLIFLSLLVIAIGIERLWFYSIIRLDDYEDRRELELDLHKRLTLVATIGSNAPYVGLLGTVIGIMLTFASIGVHTILDTKSIMAGLAMALRATALGLIVAIPSIVFYNLLLRKAEVILTNWDIFNTPIIKNKQNPRLDSREDTTINQLTKDNRDMPYQFQDYADLGSKIHKMPKMIHKENKQDSSSLNSQNNTANSYNQDDIHDSLEINNLPKELDSQIKDLIAQYKSEHKNQGATHEKN
ncbi:TonB-system energizer ExbB [Helicobacter didelphidarum]|uniref:TonB-system energizer ExbB n=1 Tax=Helicobacter didelphidarum TaxID=2040648 RepID=A0A3D8IIX0_9HELI|nr:TonB-system energizer ExbB [Helicobacter didelphidarum]